MDPAALAAIYVANVRRLLEKHGIDQSELARRLGVSRGVISRSLHSTKPPSGTTMAQVAGIFGVDVCDLLCKSGTKNEPSKPARSPKKQPRG